MKKRWILMLASLLLVSCAGEAETGLQPKERFDVVSSEAEILEKESSADVSAEAEISEAPDSTGPENPHGNAFVTGQTEELDFDVQRIGTNEDYKSLDVDILRSVEEKEALLTFYNADADHYDEAYFENRSLIAFRITHGSGSITDTVEKVVLREDGTVEVHVTVFYPEIGTDDMAYRYYLIETEEGCLLNSDNPVEVYINGELTLSLLGAHEHGFLAEPSEVEPLQPQIHSPGEGVYLRQGENFRMQNSALSDRLSEIIAQLEYKESDLCSCEADLVIDCRYGYHFMMNLEKGFVRFEKTQASMTEEQAKELAEILDAFWNDRSYGKFSYEEETGHWTADTVGVQTEGFVNTEPCEILTANQAVERAARDCTVEYENAEADYDGQADVWRITFYENDTGKRLRVYITGDGVTLLTCYSW